MQQVVTTRLQEEDIAKITVKTLYSDILYNSNSLYNVNSISTNVPV